MNDQASITFHTEGGSLPEHDEASLIRWITSIVEQRGGHLGELNYVFCSDNYLHEVNVTYLQHDTLTDIITFPYDEFPLVSGDLFISTDRVADNAKDYGVTYSDELHRVMIHGVLHLCGQSDKSTEAAEQMRNLEDWALELRSPVLLS